MSDSVLIFEKPSLEPRNDNLEMNMDLKKPQKCIFEQKIGRNSKDEKWKKIWPRLCAQALRMSAQAPNSALKRPAKCVETSIFQ